jgi:hypothetical protein
MRKAFLHFNDDEVQDELVRRLLGTFLIGSSAKFGAPITRRICEFLPFLVFSPGSKL